MTPISVLAAGETANPLLPATYDIIWSAVCFAIIFFAFWKLVLPKFRDILDERAQAIEGGIEKAERVQAEADEALARLRDYVPPARSEASPGAEMTGALSLPVRP